MTLFYYEMKKLLFNKSRLILLAVIFIICTVMGLMGAEGSFAFRRSADYRSISGWFRKTAENLTLYNLLNPR